MVCHMSLQVIVFLRLPWLTRAVEYHLSCPRVRERTIRRLPQGGAIMSTAQGAYSCPLCSCATRWPWTLRVYTPTPDGYERFLRESVGLPIDRPRPICWRALETAVGNFGQMSHKVGFIPHESKGCLGED
jgi:hypothetical protein